MRFRAVWLCKVTGENFVEADNLEEAKEKFNNGFGKDYKEIDCYDEVIDSVEEVK